MRKLHHCFSCLARCSAQEAMVPHFSFLLGFTRRGATTLTLGQPSVWLCSGHSSVCLWLAGLLENWTPHVWRRWQH